MHKRVCKGIVGMREVSVILGVVWKDSGDKFRRYFELLGGYSKMSYSMKSMNKIGRIEDIYL